MLFLATRFVVSLVITVLGSILGRFSSICVYAPSNSSIFRPPYELEAQVVRADEVYVYDREGRRWCSRLLLLEPLFGRMQSRFGLEGAGVPAFSDRHQVLFYITKGASLPDWYAPSNLVKLYSPENGRTVYVRPKVRNAFLRLKEAAQKAGYTIYANSGFRSFNVQESLFKSYLAYDKTAPAYSAVPGSSQHQTGLVIDIGAIVNGKRINYGNFRSRHAQKFREWLTENAPKYGFVQPYVSYTKSADITALTGYVEEPWHLYYVGPELANEFMESGLEFFDWLKYYFAQNERPVKIQFRKLSQEGE